MKFKHPIQNYVRTSAPTLPGSQAQWLDEELKKLERTLSSMAAALAEIAAKVT
jgi:hypothetical protein